MSNFFAFVRTSGNELELSRLTGADRKSISENLLVGRTGGWSVAGFDAENRCVGVTLDEGRFLVTEELTPESPESPL